MKSEVDLKSQDWIERIEVLIEKGNGLTLSGAATNASTRSINSGKVAAWGTQVKSLLTDLLGQEHNYTKSLGGAKVKVVRSRQVEYQEILRAVKEEILSGNIQIPAGKQNALENLCKRFHLVAKQLRSRRESRATLEIKDEYDVQDLLHALLKIFFDDVRSEEWTPSHAGASSRMDFLLKNEKTVIEVKKTREGLEDKEIGEQLLIDIGRYTGHPDCETLVCFVYDPEGRVRNPKGLEKDLNSHSNEELNVIVFIESS